MEQRDDPSGPVPPGMSMPPPPGAPWAPGPVPPVGPQFREHGSGTLILVLGILSLVVCAPLGSIAWYLANRAIEEMDRAPAVMWTNRGIVNAGRACGIVSIAILGFFVFFGLVIVAGATLG